MSETDLEQVGHRRSLAGSDVSVDVSLCFSDGDEGSCHSQFFSTTGGSGSYDEERFDFVSESDVGIVSDSVNKVEIGNEVKVNLEKVERDCRICHMGLDLDLESDGRNDSIELGCSCKDDLAAAHKQCAEAWFKIKGNKTCEICHSIAKNVTGAHEVVVEPTEQSNDSGNTTSTATSAAPGSAAAARARNFLQGHRVLNFLLACMVFAFVISWLFHFNVPS